MTYDLKILANDEDISNIEILKLSASSMKTFDQCGLKYNYQYIEKLPRLEWDHLLLGTFSHRVLEIFHKDYVQTNDFKSLDQLMTRSFKSALKEFKDIKKEISEKAKEFLRMYLDTVKVKMPVVKGVETKFVLKIGENIAVRGYLDRIDLDDDGLYHIVDYKTTQNIKYLDTFQLLVYGLWLKTKKPEVNTFKGSYILLKHKSKWQTYTFNDFDLERAKSKIISYADKIKDNIATNTWVPIPTNLCSWCDFKNVCPTQTGW